MFSGVPFGEPPLSGEGADGSFHDPLFMDFEQPRLEPRPLLISSSMLSSEDPALDPIVPDSRAFDLPKLEFCSSLGADPYTLPETLAQGLGVGLEAGSDDDGADASPGRTSMDDDADDFEDDDFLSQNSQDFAEERAFTLRGIGGDSRKSGLKRKALALAESTSSPGSSPEYCSSSPGSSPPLIGSDGELPSAASSPAPTKRRSPADHSKPLTLPLPKPRDQMTSEELASHKHKQRLLRNRQSAQLSRERKKAYLQTLESEVHQLREENLEFRGRCEELTAENKRLWGHLKAAGIEVPAPPASAHGAQEARQKRRRIAAPSPHAGGSGAGARGGAPAGAGLMLFALVFSFGVFCSMSGVPTGPGSPLVVPGQEPGHVIPALPSPASDPVAQAVAAAAAAVSSSLSGPVKVEPVVPVDPASATTAVTEFRRSAVPSAASSSAATSSASSAAASSSAPGFDELVVSDDSDNDEAPELLAAVGDTTEAQLQLTEENLKQLFDLLRSMQGSEELFPSTGPAQPAIPDPAHYMFSPQAIRFSMPGSRASTAATTVKSEHLEAGLGGLGAARQNFSFGGEDDDQARAVTEETQLKIWVPSQTLSSSLVREEVGGENLWYPSLEQVDWSDVETELGPGQASQLSTSNKLIVAPTTKGRPASSERLFHSGFTEISCTVRSLRQVLLVDKQ